MTDLNGKRFQLTFLRPSTMLQFANVLCDPPLGQSTVVPHNQTTVDFTVLVESSISFSEQPWEAVLWHNCYSNEEWNGLDLKEVEPENVPLAVSSQGRPSVYRRYFRGSLTKPDGRSRTIEFTLKYRTTNSAWKWVNDQSNLTDGKLLLQSPKLPSELSECFSDFTTAFEIVSSSSDVPNTKLWQLNLSMAAAGKDSAATNDLLGVPLDVSRWFALVRIWTPWLCPRHGKSHFGLAEDGLVCSFLRSDGLHLVLVAVSGVGNTYAVFKGDGKGGVVVASRNDGTESETSRVIAAVGYTHGTALAACMYHARKLVSGELKLTGELQAELKAHKEGEMNPQWMSEWYDGLTYCTWNGLGQGLTEQKIFDALDALEKNDIKVTNLIIDDNWQSLDNSGMYQDARGWTDFDANKEGFPKGLAYTVTEIRDRHPSIDHVSVWHAILGYWGGVSPNGNIAKNYKTKEVQKTALGRVAAGKMTVVAEEDVERLYDDFYDFLLKCRIDSVKTDAQFFLDLMHDPADRRALFKTYQDAWTIASLKYFGTRAISCMSLVPAIMFHSQLPTTKPRIMVRNSDDFFPEIPSSHPWHIFTNAYTSILTQHLNVLPDWDMFQTSHEYSTFHGAARCVSGGPIYITDEPGKHSIDLIDQMTAPSNIDHKRIILRPSTVGKTIPSSVYTAYEDERLLKVGTYHGYAETGTGIIGVFNISPKALTEFVLLGDFPGVMEQRSYIVRAHTTGEISSPMNVRDELPLLSVYLDVKGSEILTAYPLHIHGDTSVAPLGLLGKMTGAAAIMGSPVVEMSNGKLHIGVTMKALGVFGKYSLLLDNELLCNAD